jgi:hypothetical protein
MSNEDHFADIRHQINSGTGVLSGEGADLHYQATPSREQGGIGYQCRCDNCGMTSKITISWDEFIIGSCQQLPPGWTPQPRFGAFTPNIGCGQCRALIPLMLTPDECGKQVRAGVNSGQLDPNYVAQANQQIRGRAAGHRG